MKKLLALVLALVMTLSLCVTSNAAYADAADVDYTEAVDVMSAVGVFQGADGKFSPKAELTREQAAKLIAYLDLGEKVAEALPAVKAFNDVEANRWSAKYVAYCADAGYLAGVGNGNFDPAGKLTGYAFGKMLLCALGYDAKIEGFTGANWQIAVAKLMQSNDIAKGVDASASTTLTREAAAQYCLNTLKATMVEYDSKGANIAVNGATIDFGASKAKAKTWVAGEGKDYTDGGASAAGETIQLCEKLFPKLYKNAGTVNGANGYEWKLSDKTDAISDFYVSGEEVVATSTNGTSIADLTTYSTTSKKFVKKVDFTTGGTTYKVYVNGTEVAAYATTYTTTANKYWFDTTNKQVKFYNGTSSADVNGNGVKIEFVDTDDQAEYAEKIFVTIYTVDKVTKAPVVKTNTTTGKDEVTINGLGITSVETSKVKGYEGLAKDDIVTVVTMADGSYIIEKAAVTTGQVTSTTSSAMTLAGTSVKYAKNADASVAATDKFTDVNVYTDAYGYAIYSKSVETVSEDYLMILENAAYSDTTFNDGTNKSLVVLADGKTATITVASVGGKDFDASGFVVPTTGAIYNYTVNSDGTYALDADKGNAYSVGTNTANHGQEGIKLYYTAASPAEGDVTVTKGVSAATVGTAANLQNKLSAGADTTLKANSETVFVLRDIKTAGTYTFDKNGSNGGTEYKTSWSVKTGIATFNGFTKGAVSAVVGSDGYADVVFVYNYKATAATTTTDYAYITDTDFATVYKSSLSVDYYAFKAIVDGEETTLKADATARDTLDDAKGLYIVTYTDGKATGATAVTHTSFASTDYRYAKVTALAEPDGGMIVAGGTSYSYTEGCKVFEISSSGEVTIETVDDYEAIATSGTIFLVNDNADGSSTDKVKQNTLTEIYIQK